jgi:phosphatidylglycerol---prolipoprotein diacylglyceryl transferase
MGDDFILKTSPLWFRIDFISVRYYTALFFAAIVLGYLLWRWQMRRAGYPAKAIRMLALLGIPALIIGARLGHCFFYAPQYYLANPSKILFVWQGGLASHGALIAMPLVLFLLARRHHLPVMDVMDRFTFSSALGAALVRVGNFFNSEIVGRETTVPWGVRFLRFDAASKLRHPTQLYEAAVGIAVFVILLIADRKAGKEKRPDGLLTGLFLTLYFSARFLVEFTKEYQRPPTGESPLTIGQVLSIGPILLGVVILARIAWVGRRATRR